jgi:nicotinate-nucleotide pyrophosphorylase (carboxylating)
MPSDLNWKEADVFIDQAIAEDMGKGDVTTEGLIPPDTLVEGEWMAKEAACMAGLPIAEKIFKKLDPSAVCYWMVQDGMKVMPGKFGLIRGKAHAILKAERLALNLVQRLSGIATLTSVFSDKVRAYGTKIYDTRKTTPLMRSLEKYAVRMGGGYNHRFGLSDMILIKDNHREILDDLGPINWASLIKTLRQKYPGLEIEMEVTAAHQVEEAVKAGVDYILLDNMLPEQVSEIVKQWKGKVQFEASGGISLDNVEAYARAGVQRISIGALTHSAKAVDISLEILSIK